MKLNLFKNDFGLVALLIFVSVLPACSNHSYNTSAPAPAPTLISPSSVSNLSDLQLPPLTCADDKACPAAVGELIYIDGNHLSLCTATLVKPDVVLTASHCIATTKSPKEVRAEKREAGKGCWVRFPGHDQTPPTEVACAKILTMTPIDQKPGEHPHADQTMIRLASPQVGRAVQRLADPASLAEQAIHVQVFGLALSPSAHVLQHLECDREVKPVEGLNLDPRYALLMPNCLAQPGFSGGPVLKDDLQIGVMSFVHPKPFTAVAMPISALGKHKLAAH